MRFAVFRAKTMLKIDLSDFQKEATRGEVVASNRQVVGVMFLLLRPRSCCRAGNSGAGP